MIPFSHYDNSTGFDIVLVATAGHYKHLEKPTRIYIINLYSHFDLSFGTVTFDPFKWTTIHVNIAVMKS